ncbi:MAG TPA: hypothetical protein VK208_11860 [Pyrinomonadaceae bacterium]|jgi:hypothetical protein|nr:hypothetical protein [Pyrinomonadaceae bacterium]
MRSLLSRIAIALVITSLASVSAFAKGKTKTVTFESNIKVNGTMVPKGKYDLKFDEKTGELSIVKDSKVIARAATTAEKRQRKARDFVLRSTGSGADLQLTGVTFAGSDQNLLINGSQASR